MSLTSHCTNMDLKESKYKAKHSQTNDMSLFSDERESKGYGYYKESNEEVMAVPIEERLDIKEEYFPENDEEDYDDEIVDKFLAYLHQIYSEETQSGNARSFPVSRNTTS